MHPIKAFRKDHNLTLEEFGALVGVQKAIVGKWEHGAQPSPRLAKAIEDATKGAISCWQLRPDLWAEPAPREWAYI
jgi:DNA-binding transcriptional regulator YdaS (Cro superfamily)